LTFTTSEGGELVVDISIDAFHRVRRAIALAAKRALMLEAR